MDKELLAQLEARDKELKALVEKANEEAKNAGTIAADTKAQIEALVKGNEELHARLLEMEQKALRTASESTETKTIGQQFADSDGFKALASGQAKSARFNFKGFNAAVTNITSSPTGTGGVGSIIVPDRQPGIITPPERFNFVRDLILPGRTSSNSVQFVQETGYQNMAAMVAEGGAKPQSDLKLELVDTPVRTLAHWFRASKQVLDDIPLLQSYIDQRSRYGLKEVEDAELLAGDGTGQHLLGLIPQATDFDDGLRKEGDTKIDTIRRAILQVRIAKYRASGIIMSPADWAEIETAKDANGQYIWSDPRVLSGQNLWGLPVIDSDIMPDGEFLVGAFNRAAQVFDREDANVQVSTEDGDNFTTNMVTIRAEERLALAVTRPEAFVYGPFDEA